MSGDRGRERTGELCSAAGAALVLPCEFVCALHPISPPDAADRHTRHTERHRATERWRSRAVSNEVACGPHGVGSSSAGPVTVAVTGATAASARAGARTRRQSTVSVAMRSEGQWVCSSCLPCRKSALLTPRVMPISLSWASVMLLSWLSRNNLLPLSLATSSLASSSDRSGMRLRR